MAPLRVTLQCPHCQGLSRRPIGFVRARTSFVCDHCREIVRIGADVMETSVAGVVDPMQVRSDD